MIGRIRSFVFQVLNPDYPVYPCKNRFLFRLSHVKYFIRACP